MKRAVSLAVIAGASSLAACQLSADPAIAPSQSRDVLSPAEGDEAVDTTRSLSAADGPSDCPDGLCCSLQPDPIEPDPLQLQLGCGPTYQYRKGTGPDLLVGWGSFCPDSLANRRILHDRGKRGYLPGYCESCLCVPAGQIFVFWGFADDPTCPSGCGPMPPQV